MTHNRVLIFSTDDHLYPAGGAEQAMGNITERLPDITFDLICAKLRPGVSGYEKVKNVHIYRMGFGIPRLDGFIVALFGHYCARKLMKKNSYDLMWSVMASYGAFAAVRVKKKTSIPFLLTLQEGDSFEHIYRRVRFVRKKFNEIFQLADGIQAISHYLLRWGKEMGYRGNHGKVIPNGVAIDAFTKNFDTTEIAKTRGTFGFPSDAFILITSSRLERKNGVADVIEALTMLPPRVCFVVCGSGSLEGELRALVEKHDLWSRIRFKGFVDPSELPLLMKASDAFIRPSLTEGLGNAFLEAMAARIITVGTRAGGIPDFLKEGETGFLVEIESPRSIVSTTERIMLLSEEERKRILDRAEFVVRDRHDWNHIADDMRKLFIELNLECT